MKKVTLLTLACIIALPVFANGAYQDGSGNLCTTRYFNNGSKEVSCTNPQTGAQWSTTIKKDGSMSGYNAKGEYWYKNTSGMYHNTTTGEVTVRGQRL